VTVSGIRSRERTAPHAVRGQVVSTIILTSAGNFRLREPISFRTSPCSASIVISESPKALQVLSLGPRYWATFRALWRMLGRRTGATFRPYHLLPWRSAVIHCMLSIEVRASRSETYSISDGDQSSERLISRLGTGRVRRIAPATGMYRDKIRTRRRQL
jgi:hypothetical protein